MIAWKFMARIPWIPCVWIMPVTYADANDVYEIFVICYINIYHRIKNACPRHCVLFLVGNDDVSNEIIYITMRSFITIWTKYNNIVHYNNLVDIFQELCVLLSCLMTWSWSINRSYIVYIYELMQERRNSSATTLELRLSCTNPSIHPLGIETTTPTKHNKTKPC